MKKLINRIKENEDFKDFFSGFFMDLLNGNFLTKKFFKRQYWLIILLVLLAVAYINNRFESEKMITTISTLKKDIQDAKYESLTISAELMEISRLSNIQKLLDSKNMKLKTGSQPPIIIE